MIPYIFTETDDVLKKEQSRSFLTVEVKVGVAFRNFDLNERSCK